MTLIDQNGYFVGQISDVTNNASRVLLMISPSSSVGAQDEVTRATGLIEGRFSERPLLRFVNTRQKLQPGDFIVTSGQYNLFPQNIIIGQVMSVTHRPVDPVQTAEIVPSADFSNLELVQVVKSFVPSVPFKVKVP
jgi:rod shape-determining protein MreC